MDVMPNKEVIPVKLTLNINNEMDELEILEKIAKVAKLSTKDSPHFFFLCVCVRPGLSLVAH